MMDRFFFRFSTFSEKMKHDFFFACSIEFRSFELLVYLCGSIKCLLKDYYKLCESIGKIITGVINATDSLTGNITRPDSLSPLIYLWYCNLKPWRPCWFTRANFQCFSFFKLVFHAPHLWNEVGDSKFFFHFWNK